MNFEKGYLYHIYNQGNNRQKIFFERENYLFFLQKIKSHITPFANMLAWCLMPNHFHLMVRVNELELTLVTTGSATQSRAPSSRITTLNKEIGIMIASYTRAIQKQEEITGSLFKQKTKAECLNSPSGITPSFYNTKYGTQMHLDNPKKEYPQVCFHYIHQNPVKANMVKLETDWEFSSAQDYAGIRKGTLVNKDVTKQYVEF